MTRFSWPSVMLAGVVYGVMISGCTFSAPQVESAISVVKTIIPSYETMSTDEPATWFASVDGKGAILTPYVSNGLIVFANTDGDAIAFDGWVVRSVVGFGLQDPLSISVKNGVRIFTIDGQQTVINCEQWRLKGLNWSQTCSNGPSEIVLDDEGNIQKITMAIGNGSGIVTLRVAK